MVSNMARESRAAATVPRRSQLRYNYHTGRSETKLGGTDRTQSQDQFTSSIDEFNRSNYRLPRLYVGAAVEGPVVHHSFGALVDPDPSKVAPVLSQGASIPLSSEQSHFLTNVLRLFKKENVSSARLFDGISGEWLTVLKLEQEASKKQRGIVVALCMEEWRKKQAENGKSWLCIAPPRKKERLRWLMEKTTELNVHGFVFVESDHGKNPELPPVSKLNAHLLEAAEQCERLDLPQVCIVAQNKAERTKVKEATLYTSLDEFFTVWAASDTKPALFICRERRNAHSIWNALMENSKADSSSSVAFLIGPEGGWSLQEETKMDELEAQFPGYVWNVSLGPTILRVETAAITAMAAYTLFQDYQNKEKQL